MKIEPTAVTQAVNQRQTKDLEKLKNLSMEFESFFMKEVVKSMRDTVPKDGLLHGGNAEEIYKSMFDDKLAESMAKDGSSGIADTLYRQLSDIYLNTEAVKDVSAGKKEELAKL